MTNLNSLLDEYLGYLASIAYKKGAKKTTVSVINTQEEVKQRLSTLIREAEVRAETKGLKSIRAKKKEMGMWQGYDEIIGDRIKHLEEELSRE